MADEHQIAVHAIDAAPTALLLAWPDIPKAVKYELQFRPLGDEQWSTLGQQGFTSGMPPKLKKNLPPGTMFEFRVRGRDQVDWMPWSATSEFRTLTDQTLRMDAPRCVAADSSSLTIEWQPITGASAYEIQMRESKDPAWHTLSASFTNNVVRKKNLTPGAKYTFRVKPVAFEEQTEGEDWYYGSVSDEFSVKALSPALQRLFGAGELTNARGESVSVDQLAGCVVALYFSAHWCPPCRQFTPRLAQLYTQAKNQGLKFEVVFFSSDQDPASMQEYLNEMPWLAVPFSSPVRSQVPANFGIQGIPHLKVFSPSGNVVDENAVQSGRLSLAQIQAWGAQ